MLYEKRITNDICIAIIIKLLMPMESLERPYSLRILILLAKYGSLTITELTKKLNVKSRIGVMNCIKDLLSVNLVIEETSSKFPFERRIALTETGERLAKVLLGLEKIILEKIPELEKKVAELERRRAEEVKK